MPEEEEPQKNGFWRVCLSGMVGVAEVVREEKGEPESPVACCSEFSGEDLKFERNPSSLGFTRELKSRALPAQPLSLHDQENQLSE